MARLDEVCSINMGQSPESSTYNETGEGVPFFQGNADFGIIHPTVRIWCTSPTKIAHSEDILVSVRAPIGALNIADIDCCIGRGLAALTVNEKLSHKKYIWYAIQSKIDELNSKGTGSTFKAISKNILGETEIPLPSLERQQDIATTLDKLTTLISLRKQQLAKLDELVKARFVEMFGEPSQNPRGWMVELLSNYLEVVGGYAFKSNRFQDSGIPILRIGNINSGRFMPTNLVYWQNDLILERYKIYPGDLVMSLTGTVGKDDYGNVCIMGNEYPVYYLNQRNAKLELQSSINKYYLAELLKFKTIKGQLTGISRGIRQANILNRDILNLIIPIPPIFIQNQYADFVEQVNCSKLTVQRSLDKMNVLKNYLMQKYFG